MSRLALLILGCVGLLGTAQASDAVSLSVKNHVQVGAGSASLTVSAAETGSVQVDLKCSGERFSMRASMAAGTEKTLEFRGLWAGTHPCKGSLQLSAGGGTAQMPLDFEVTVHEPLAITAPSDTLDLTNRTVSIQSSRPLASARIEVIGPQRAVLAQSEINVDQSGQYLLGWDPTEGEVLQIIITGTDTHGLRGERVLSPWSYAIPHEDVAFASGSHDVVAAEVPKLEAAWTELQAVRAKYGDVVQMKLFVAGYTDTMGDNVANLALSERRAKSIAAWFKSRGFTGEVLFQGFGEDVLAVETYDDVDEPANRRAAYIVAADTPIKSEQLPHDHWQRLP